MSIDAAPESAWRGNSSIATGQACRSVLFVDDDEQLRGLITRVLAGAGWDVNVAVDAKSCLDSYDRNRPDVVLLDLSLPGLSGLHILELLRHKDPDATVVMLSGEADIRSAVDAMQLGAENFLSKPVQTAHLDAALARAHEKAVLRRQARFFSSQTSSPCSLTAVNASAQMREVARFIEVFAPGNAPVLLTGETGTGKGWVARLIHQASARASAPLVEVNCGGLSATFLDSELFGHEKGAFTDAKSQKRGLFEVADHGTLFLDEVGDLAPELQPKLLKVLEDQRFRRLGGTRELTVDVRLIAATHHDLAKSVADGRFREDLFYRLSVLPLRIPPLRERGSESIVALTYDLLQLLQKRLGQGPSQVTAESLQLLTQYSWPGNVRELRNVLERVLLLAADADSIRPEHLPIEIRQTHATVDETPLDTDLSLQTAELQHIARVLAHFGGNRVRAARALGISRATLYKRLEELSPARSAISSRGDDVRTPDSAQDSDTAA